MKKLLILMVLQLLNFPLFFLNFFTLFSFQNVRLIWGSLILIGLFFGLTGVIKRKEDFKMFMLSTLTVITSLCLLFFTYFITLASM